MLNLLCCVRWAGSDAELKKKVHILNLDKLILNCHHLNESL